MYECGWDTNGMVFWMFGRGSSSSGVVVCG